MGNADLIARLREAKEGSYELDCEVTWRIDRLSRPNYRERDGAREVNVAHHIGGEPDWRPIGPYEFGKESYVTTDLSAAVALAERALPHCLIERIGCDGMVSENGAPAIKLIWVAEIARFGETIEAEAPTAPLALTLAILMAKKESGK